MAHDLPTLVDDLVSVGMVKTGRIERAFRRVDRGHFVLPEYEGEAYSDMALPIGYGQTISQPYTAACMRELLQPKAGESVLDVGSDSGWTTALLADMVGPNGSVWVIRTLTCNTYAYCRIADRIRESFGFAEF
jgi:protein-L-isoaspartate(D-aspartate) O-methyltransferase